jgi:hypothetical protein
MLNVALVYRSLTQIEKLNIDCIPQINTFRLIITPYYIFIALLSWMFSIVWRTIIECRKDDIRCTEAQH